MANWPRILLTLLSISTVSLFGEPRPCVAGDQLGGKLEPGEYPPSRIVFSPDGEYLLTGTFYEATLWKLETGARVHSLRGGFVGDGFSPDGSLVLTSECKGGPVYPPDTHYVTAWLWRAATGKILATYKRNTLRVATAAFCPDSRLLLFADRDETATLVDLNAGRNLAEYEASSSQPSVGFAPNGDAYFTGHSQKLTVWDRNSLERRSQIAAPRTSFQTASFVADSNNFVTGCFDGKVIVWNAGNGERIRTIEAHSSYVTVTEVTHDGKRLLTASANRFIHDWSADWSASPHLHAKLWNVETGELVRTFTHAGPITDAQLSDDGTRLLTTWHRPMKESPHPKLGVTYTDLAATLWDVEAGIEVLNVNLTAKPAIAALSRNGKRVFTEGPEMRLWDAEMGQLIREYPMSK